MSDVLTIVTEMLELSRLPVQVFTCSMSMTGVVRLLHTVALSTMGSCGRGDVCLRAAVIVTECHWQCHSLQRALLDTWVLQKEPWYICCNICCGSLKIVHF